MPKLSKKLYLGLIIGAYAAGMACLITGVIMIAVLAVTKGGKFTIADMGLFVPCILFLLLGMAASIIAGVCGYVLLYKAWQAIQDGQPRTTPGKAVGFLFIPFFNFYWMFIAYWGWAKDCNAYISSKGLSLSPLPEKLYLAFPIILLCSGIPYVTAATALGSYQPYVVAVPTLAAIAVFIIISTQMIDRVNGIYDARVITTA